jgi:hypothetical protein
MEQLEHIVVEPDLVELQCIGLFLGCSMPMEELIQQLVP